MKNSDDFALHLNSIFTASPSSIAVETYTSDISWGKLNGLCDAITAEFKRLNLEEGCPVGVVARNQIGHIASLISIISTGRCFVTINPFQASVGISADIAELRPPVVVVAEEDIADTKILTTLNELGSVAIIIKSDATITVVNPDRSSAIGSEKCTALPGTAVLMLTSGTTGKPKRLRLDFNSLISATTSQLPKNYSKHPVTVKAAPTIVSNPISHISGLFFVVSSIIDARPIILLDRFRVEYWANMVEKHRIRYASLVPAAIRMIYDAGVPKSKLSSLIALGSGAARLPPELQLNFEIKYEIPILTVYGATEFSGAIAGWTLPLHKSFIDTKIGSVGRAFPGTKLRVVDIITGQQLPTNEAGLLEVHSAQSTSQDAWIRTTDIASIDEDDFVWIKGRADASINRGGFKILPDEIEDVLKKHPSIADAVVVGIADDRLGQVPVAAIELHPAMTASYEEIVEFLRTKLPSYKVPVKIRIVPELPRSGALKIRLSEVQSLF